MKTAVVIPNWNGADLLTECLQSLQQQTHAADIIVVDNGSRDASVSIIEANFPEVTLVKLAENTGFAGGVNVGIRHAIEKKYDAVALFNNDAAADKDWLKHLVTALQTMPDSGIVTGKFMRDDKEHFDSTGECYSIWGMPFPRGRNQKDNGQFDKQEKVFGATGGASLYRVKMLEEIGLFDEYFFAYFEDIDISFRARLAGWQVIYTPLALAFHKIGSTSSKLGTFTRYHATKNFYLLYAKNMPRWLYWKYLPFFVLQATRLLASSLLKGGGWTYMRGLVQAILLTPHIIRERRRIQTGRTVSNAAIDTWLYKHRPPRITKI